jgi:hypothetical protein
VVVMLEVSPRPAFSVEVAVAVVNLGGSETQVRIELGGTLVELTVVDIRVSNPLEDDCDVVVFEATISIPSITFAVLVQ